MQHPTLHVFLVEDSLSDAHYLKTLLEKSKKPFELTHFTRLQEALDAPELDKQDVLLLDITLPDAHGMEAIVTAHITAPEIPIIVISGLDSEETSVNALQAGAQDYLLKNTLASESLIRSIRYATERNRLTVALNELNRQQQYLATHDELTGLPNRQLLYDRLGQTIARSERYNYRFALIFLDLDSFKAINDSLGHHLGDELLTISAQRLSSCIRETDTVARLGGDEFSLILTRIPSIDMAANVCQEILDVLASPFMLNDNEYYISASTGIAIYPDDGQDAKTLLRNADTAMYSAKEQGRNKYKFYTHGMNATSYRRLTLASNLRRAVENNEFVLHYQPIIQREAQRILGVEALVRWQHPDFGLLTPNEFITFAEENGLIIPLGQWIIKEACHQLGRWHDAGFKELNLCLNFSSKQFEDESSWQYVIEAAHANNIDPHRICLELTESILMKHPELTTNTLHNLKALGVKIAIDDFGTGYSSLSYLKQFPIDLVKIDRSFIHDVTSDKDALCIVRAILALAESLKLHVLAEGVETPAQEALLLKENCPTMQGFLFSKPLSAEICTEFFQAHHHQNHGRIVPLSQSFSLK